MLVRYNMLQLGGNMTMVSLDEAQLKELLKAELVEVLEERRDLVRDVIEEALEDWGLARAIEEGEQTNIVARETIFTILNADA